MKDVDATFPEPEEVLVDEKYFPCEEHHVDPR